MFGKIDHIGIAVRSIDDALLLYRDKLGFEVIAQETVLHQGVKVAFLAVGHSLIELLEPLDETSPVAKFIEKRGEGIHHLALGCASIDDARALATENRLRLLSDEPLRGAHGKLISFVHPKDTGGVLLEFTQPAEEP